MRFDADRMRELFNEIPAPDSLDRWRVSQHARPRRRSNPAAVASAVAVLAVTLVTAGFAVAVSNSGGTPITVNPSPTSPEPSRVPPAPSPTPSPASSLIPSPSSSPTRSAPLPAPLPAQLPAQLPVHQGDLHVRTAGAVVSDLHVTGTIHVEAPNVTLRRVRVARESDGYWAVRQYDTAPNLTVEDSEIGGDGRNAVQYGLMQEADGLVVRKTVVRAVEMGITALTNATIEDTRISDLLPSESGFGIVCHGGGPITVRRNTIIMPAIANAAIALYADNRPIAGVQITGNVLGGGRSTLHAGGQVEATITGNRFRRQPEPVRWDTGRPKVWSNNVWDDNGAAINL